MPIQSNLPCRFEGQGVCACKGRHRGSLAESLLKLYHIRQLQEVVIRPYIKFFCLLLADVW